jgi:hypothetical protein
VRLPVMIIWLVVILIIDIPRDYMLITCSYNSYHEGFKKWVEVGNSGMFRPEMLRPMGLPEDVQVIAWGLSLER